MRTNEASLASALESLAAAIFALVRQSKDSGELVVERTTYFLRPNFNLTYSVDPTVMNFGLEEVEEEVWNYKKQSDFVELKVKRLHEFQVVESLVGSDTHDAQLLRSFAFTVAGASLSAGSLESLSNYVGSLLGDIQKKARRCRAKVWLTGVTLGCESVRASDALVLRRPTRSDLQEKVTAESAHYAHAFQPRIWFSCIADLQLRGLYPMARQGEVEKLVLALRLFRLGSVSSSMYAFESDSFDPFSNATLGGPGRAGREAYEVSPSDAPALAAFLDEIVPLLPTNFEVPESKRDYISIALHWYGESLLATVPLEGSVASAIACLEALFLESVQTEMSYRLGVRIAGLLRCFGLSPLDAQSVVKQAYDVRSKYVHGDEQDKKWSIQKLLVLSRSVLDYSRLALLVFCQLKGKISRHDLLALVDSSLLDDKSRLELGVLCYHVKFCGTPA